MFVKAHLWSNNRFFLSFFWNMHSQITLSASTLHLPANLYFFYPAFLQTAIKMYKIACEERFLLWAVCSIQLQVWTFSSSLDIHIYWWTLVDFPAKITYLAGDIICIYFQPRVRKRNRLEKGYKSKPWAPNFEIPIAWANFWRQGLIWKRCKLLLSGFDYESQYGKRFLRCTCFLWISEDSLSWNKHL